MSFEQQYSDGRLYIGEESFPVKRFEMRVEADVGTDLQTFQFQTLRQFLEFTFICDVGLEGRFLLPDPLCDIEFHYTTYKKHLFVDVPLKNCLYIKGAKVGIGPVFTFLDGKWEVECSFRDGDWTLEVGAFT